MERPRRIVIELFLNLPMNESTMKTNGLEKPPKAKSKIFPTLLCLKATFLTVFIGFGSAVAEPVKNRDKVTELIGNLITTPAGWFWMGSPKTEPARDWGEEDQQQVCMHSFEIMENEVSFQQYDAFADATGRNKPKDEDLGRGDNPVVNVSLVDAMDFASYVSQKTGMVLRLPTEAEWEYAARAGGNTQFPWGNNILDRRYVNAYEDSSSRTHPVDPTIKLYDELAPANSLLPNNWGIYHMAGNVSEWTCSVYHRNYSPNKISCDDNGSKYVVRGGNWRYDDLDLFRSARRDHDFPSKANILVGFRLVHPIGGDCGRAPSRYESASIYRRLAMAAAISGDVDLTKKYLDEANSMLVNYDYAKHLIEIAQSKNRLNLNSMVGELADIPAGCFLVGGDIVKSDASLVINLEPDNMTVNQEGQSSVCVESFKIMTKEATIMQMNLFLSSQQLQPLPVGVAGQPVYSEFSFIKRYAQWLSWQTGMHFRLPTAAEWEYAARAGTSTNYYWGDAPSGLHANGGYRWPKDGYEGIAPVGSYEPNSWGLYDMIGNANEWTCSVYDPEEISTIQLCTNNSMEPIIIKGGSGIVRGLEAMAPSFNLSDDNLWNHKEKIGFRLVVSNE